MKRRRRDGQPSLVEEIKAKKGVATLYVVMRLLIVAMMVLQFFNRNFENVFLCVLTLILLLLPTFIERKIHIDLPDTLEVIIMLFIFAAEILGEISAFYINHPNWDTMLHTLNGFLCAAIGFSMVDILNRNDKFSFSLSPLFMALVAFCFSMTIGVLWEFFEFGMDQLILFDMQKDTVLGTISTVMLDPKGGTNTVVVRGIQDTILVLEDGSQMSLGLGGYLDVGILDTMRDLIVNFIGAVVFSIIGFFYVKNRGQGKFARRFIPRVLSDREIEDKSAGEE